MRMRIEPSVLHGQIDIQPSKSAAHRALLSAALAPGASTIVGVPASEDLIATRCAVQALLGADIEEIAPATLRVVGGRFDAGAPRADVPCNESGSTLRFLIPQGWRGRPARFTGTDKLLSRPLGAYASIAARQNLGFSRAAEGLATSGVLRAGHFVLPGDVSSQFLTGLLHALPLLDGDSIVEMASPLESRGYVDMTIDMLRRFGVRIERDGETYLVPGRQSFRPADVQVESDWSHACFYLAANELGGDVHMTGLDDHSLQPDRQMVAALLRMRGLHPLRATARASDARTLLKKVAQKAPVSVVDASQMPDAVPALAVAALGRVGITRVINAGRLRLKECDRLSALADVFTRLGGDIRALDDTLTIVGGGMLRGGAAYAHNDHRIAMALAIAAPLCTAPIWLEGAECVAKSAPNFWREYRGLGGRAAEV